jgi:hypothetical protein
MASPAVSPGRSGGALSRGMGAGLAPRGKMPPAVQRRLVTLAAAVSLVLCIATVTLCVRSYSLFDRVSREDRAGVETELYSVSGRVVLSHFNGSDGDKPKAEWTVESVQPTSPMGRALYASFVSHPQERWWCRSGFDAYLRVSAGIGRTVAEITVPHWFLAFLWAVLPAQHLRAIFRSRRLREHALCSNCGYDLRATPDRCPECGAAPAATAAR